MRGGLRGLGSVKRGKIMQVLFQSALLLGISHVAAGSAIHILTPSSATYVLPIGYLHFLLTILGSLVIVCSIIIYFSLKLRRVNRALSEKNRELEVVNGNLQRTNVELTQQKEIIAREHYESDKFFKILLQSANDGISYYDKDWNLKFSNSAFYSIIGYDRESYHNENPDLFLHPDDHDYPQKRLEALKHNGFHECELRLRHKGGYYVNMLSRSVTIRDEFGGIMGALTISRDITKMKEVYEDLVKANIEAETSNRLKSSFLANISHEIRTPLNSVVGFSNLLLSEDLTSEAKEEYIEHINHNSEKLLQIIGDIIDLSRLESSQIEINYEESSIHDIVHEVVNEARQQIRRNEKSIMLDVKNGLGENSDLIFTDKIWLKRVLCHLMDNAVKFTLDGAVDISYYRENDELFFKIKDTGIGINKENLSRIFEQFRQEIDGHHRPFEGLGIGLTLAKEVVERMGGRIDVESEKGVGSIFTFSIPYRPAGSTRSRIRSMIADQIAAPINWTGKKCLLVDDNKDILIYLNRILLDTGITVLMARSGIEAVEAVTSNNDLDVIILDMQMPEMNGIEATKEIRKRRKDIPIIAQTAFIFEDDKDIILEAGCDACLIKPIRQEHLLAVMRSFVKSN